MRDYFKGGSKMNYDDNYPKNKDPFEPWNNPFTDDPFKPWNNPMYRDDPFAPWNSPFGTQDGDKEKYDY